MALSADQFDFVDWKKTLMGKGGEGHAGENGGRQARPRTHKGHCEKLTETHDDASREAQQRRSGSRFRYRRRRQSTHRLRPTQNAQFNAFFLAALWTTLAATSVMASIGTIASRTDPGSDWTSVRTAVETRLTPMPSICYLCTQLYDSSAHDFTTATPSSHRAYATFCYTRPWPAPVRASLQLQLQRTYTRSRPPVPSSLARRLSLPATRQLQPASESPITCSRSPADRIAPIPAAFQPV